jgi:hypothetical protein
LRDYAIERSCGTPLGSGDGQIRVGLNFGLW